MIWLFFVFFIFSLNYVLYGSNSNLSSSSILFLIGRWFFCSNFFDLNNFRLISYIYEDNHNFEYYNNDDEKHQHLFHVTLLFLDLYWILFVNLDILYEQTSDFHYYLHHKNCFSFLDLLHCYEFICSYLFIQSFE